MVSIADQLTQELVPLLFRSGRAMEKHSIVSQCRRGCDGCTQDKPTQGECNHLSEGETRGSVICARHGSGPPLLQLSPATTLVWVTAGEGHMQVTEVTHRACVAARLTVGSLVIPLRSLSFASRLYRRFALVTRRSSLCVLLVQSVVVQFPRRSMRSSFFSLPLRRCAFTMAKYCLKHFHFSSYVKQNQCRQPVLSLVREFAKGSFQYTAIYQSVITNFQMIFERN